MNRGRDARGRGPEAARDAGPSPSALVEPSAIEPLDFDKPVDVAAFHLGGKWPLPSPAHPCGAADARGPGRQNTARTLNRVALLTLGRAERGMLCLRLSPSRLAARS